MSLQRLDLIQSAAFLDHQTQFVRLSDFIPSLQRQRNIKPPSMCADRSHLRRVSRWSTHHEDVGNGVQDDEDRFAVLGGKQVQERLQDVGLNEVNHLLNSAPTGEVCYCPHSLLLSLIVALQRIINDIS